MTHIVSATIGACVLALVSFAAPRSQAQTVSVDSVEIGGWALPEGTVVDSRSRVVYKATIRDADGVEIPYRLDSDRSSRMRVDRVQDGRLERAVQRVTEGRTVSTVEAGKGQTAPPDALLGLDVIVERGPDGWTQSASGWTPTDEQTETLAHPITLDDDEYPARMAVGQTVEVPIDAVERIYPGLTTDPARLTVRLDSVGTADGGPAAFLTQSVHVTTAGDGFITRMDMTAQVVRRLDWRIDASTRWTGRMTTEYSTFVIDGVADSHLTQRLLDTGETIR